MAQASMRVPLVRALIERLDAQASELSQMSFDGERETPLWMRVSYITAFALILGMMTHWLGPAWAAGWVAWMGFDATEQTGHRS